MTCCGSAFVGLVLLVPSRAIGEDQTVGLFLNAAGACEGYTLFAPLWSSRTYLINNSGELVHRWRSQYPPGAAAYLKDNGHLIRTANPGEASLFTVGGAGGLVQEFDWDGELLWEFECSDANQRSHHDIALLPNGNLLLIAWEWRSATEAIAAGRNPALLDGFQLWPDKIVEVHPHHPAGGTIVWEWHVWDHLIQDFDPTQANYGSVSDHPELVDLNFIDGDGRNPDWLHANSIDYHAEFDQVLLNVPTFGEFWIIDHSTTTEQAANHTGGRSGRGGDVLYRWGNPRAYRAGTIADQQFYWQHGTHWIRPGRPGSGHLLVFNNGAGRPEGAWSSVEEIIPPVDDAGQYARSEWGPFEPREPMWIYTADPPASLYSSALSGADRLPNGNTLVCEGMSGRFLEITSEKQTIWEYTNPVNYFGPVFQGQNPRANSVFRAERYPLGFPGLYGRDLKSQGKLELDRDATLRIVAIQHTDDYVRLSWASRPDRSYSVEYSDQLEPSAWITVGSQMAIGTLSHFLDTDPIRLRKQSGYYRIVDSP